MALTPEQRDTIAKLDPIFFPYFTYARARMIRDSGRFVHYTSAENALKIIRFTNRLTWDEIVRLYRLTMKAPPHNLPPRYARRSSFASVALRSSIGTGRMSRSSSSSKSKALQR
jgi:hypothetical protein